MNVTLNIENDKELRAYIKDAVKGQVLSIVREEMMEIIKEELERKLKGLTSSRFDNITKDATKEAVKSILLKEHNVRTWDDSFIKPLIENATNWNFFLQRNIVPESKERLLPEHQATTYSSETAKALGKALKYSPAKIENLIRGYWAGAGRYALQGSDIVLNQWRRMSGEIIPQNPVEAADIPALKGFITRDPIGPSAESIQKFYTKANDITTAWNSAKQLIDSGDKEGAVKIFERFPEMKHFSDVSVVTKRLSELRKRRANIRNMLLPPELKKDLYKGIDREMVDLAQGFNLKLKRK